MEFLVTRESQPVLLSSPFPTCPAGQSIGGPMPCSRYVGAATTHDNDVLRASFMTKGHVSPRCEPRYASVRARPIHAGLVMLRPLISLGLFFRIKRRGLAHAHTRFNHCDRKCLKYCVIVCANCSRLLAVLF